MCVAQAVPGRFIHTTSFGLEGQALAHLIVESGVEAESSRSIQGGCFQRPTMFGPRRKRDIASKYVRAIQTWRP